MATKPGQSQRKGIEEYAKYPKRPRLNDDHREPLNATLGLDGTKHIRRAKKMRTRRAQIAKPLIRPRRTISPPLTNSEGNTSSSDSSDILKRRENKATAHIPKRSKRRQMPASPPEAPDPPPEVPVSPPPSPKVPQLSDSQPPSSDNITPASLRDYMMSGRYHDCLLGEEINDIILGEYQAAESWNLGVEQPGVIC